MKKLHGIPSHDRWVVGPCVSDAIARQVLKIGFDAGLGWVGDDESGKTYWSNYKDKTYYDLTRRQLSNIDFYSKVGFTIISAETFIANNRLSEIVEELNEKIMTTTIENIKQWGYTRNLINKQAAPMQLLKTVEELGETAGALLKGNRAGLKDGIGDILVTLILFAEIEGLSLEECLQAAWQEIKDRKGSTVDGVFIKS